MKNIKIHLILLFLVVANIDTPSLAEDTTDSQERSITQTDKIIDDKYHRLLSVSGIYKNITLQFNDKSIENIPPLGDGITQILSTSIHIPYDCDLELDDTGVAGSKITGGYDSTPALTIDLVSGEHTQKIAVDISVENDTTGLEKTTEVKKTIGVEIKNEDDFKIKNCEIKFAEGEITANGVNGTAVLVKTPIKKLTFDGNVSGTDHGLMIDPIVPKEDKNTASNPQAQEKFKNELKALPIYPQIIEVNNSIKGKNSITINHSGYSLNNTNRIETTNAKDAKDDKNFIAIDIKKPGNKIENHTGAKIISGNIGIKLSANSGENTIFNYGDIEAFSPIVVEKNSDIFIQNKGKIIKTLAESNNEDYGIIVKGKLVLDTDNPIDSNIIIDGGELYFTDRSKLFTHDLKISNGTAVVSGEALKLENNTMEVVGKSTLTLNNVNGEINSNIINKEQIKVADNSTLTIKNINGKINSTINISGNSKLTIDNSLESTINSTITLSAKENTIDKTELVITNRSNNNNLNGTIDINNKSFILENAGNANFQLKSLVDANIGLFNNTSSAKLNSSNENKFDFNGKLEIRNEGIINSLIKSNQEIKLSNEPGSFVYADGNILDLSGYSHIINKGEIIGNINIQNDYNELVVIDETKNKFINNNYIKGNISFSAKNSNQVRTLENTTITSSKNIADQSYIVSWLDADITAKNINIFLDNLGGLFTGNIGNNLDIYNISIYNKENGSWGIIKSNEYIKSFNINNEKYGLILAKNIAITNINSNEIVLHNNRKSILQCKNLQVNGTIDNSSFLFAETISPLFNTAIKLNNYTGISEESSNSSTGILITSKINQVELNNQQNAYTFINDTLELVTDFTSNVLNNSQIKLFNNENLNLGKLVCKDLITDISFLNKGTIIAKSIASKNSNKTIINNGSINCNNINNLTINMQDKAKLTIGNADTTGIIDKCQVILTEQTQEKYPGDKVGEGLDKTLEKINAKITSIKDFKHDNILQETTDTIKKDIAIRNNLNLAQLNESGLAKLDPEDVTELNKISLYEIKLPKIDDLPAIIGIDEYFNTDALTIKSIEAYLKTGKATMNGIMGYANSNTVTITGDVVIDLVSGARLNFLKETINTGNLHLKQKDTQDIISLGVISGKIINSGTVKIRAGSYLDEYEDKDNGRLIIQVYDNIENYTKSQGNKNNKNQALLNANQVLFTNDANRKENNIKLQLLYKLSKADKEKIIKEGLKDIRVVSAPTIIAASNLVEKNKDKELNTSLNKNSVETNDKNYTLQNHRIEDSKVIPTYSPVAPENNLAAPAYSSAEPVNTEANNDSANNNLLVDLLVEDITIGPDPSPCPNPDPEKQQPAKPKISTFEITSHKENQRLMSAYLYKYRCMQSSACQQSRLEAEATTIWGKSFFNKTKQSSTLAINKHNSKIASLLLGADYRQDQTTIGLAFGLMQADTTINDNQDINSTTHAVMLYANYIEQHWFLNAQYSYDFSKHELESAVVKNLATNYSSYANSLQLITGTCWYKNKMQISPAASLRLSSMWLQGYAFTEDTADIERTSESNYNYADLGFGISAHNAWEDSQYATKLRGSIMLYRSLYHNLWQADYQTTEGAVLVGVSPLAKMSYELELAADLHNYKNWILSLEFLHYGSHSLNSNSLSLRLRYHFK